MTGATYQGVQNILSAARIYQERAGFTLMRVAAILYVSVACLWVSAPCHAEGDMFVVPPDDLPVAMVGAYRVAFTRNGAFVVSRNGHWLFDGGLSYAMAGSSEWGAQIRRSDARDTWHLKDQGGRVLVADGTLFDITGIARFKFIQRTEIIPGGLRLHYEVTPLEKRTLQEFGLMLRLPVAETRDAWAAFWPGFVQAELPTEFGSSVLQEAASRGSVLYVSSESQVAAVGQATLAWRLGDDQPTRSNAYRLIGGDMGLLGPLGQGQTVPFSFEILLGNGVARALPLDQGYCDVDRYGRLAVRASADKLIEGGLMLGSPSVQWLCARSEPSSDVKRAEDEWTATASGDADVDLEKCTYEVNLSAPQKGAIAIYRVRPALAKDAGDVMGNILVGFAVPKPTVVSAPTLDGPTAANSDTAPGGHSICTAKLISRDGMTVELGSDSPWSLADTKLDGTDCFLLSTKLHQEEGGVREAQIRISTHQTQLSPEK